MLECPRYLLGVTLEIIEEIDSEIGGIIQGEIGLTVVNAHEDAADHQLFDVRLVDVGGSVGGVALARSNVSLLLTDQELQQLTACGIVPDQHRILRVVGHDFQ